METMERDIKKIGTLGSSLNELDQLIDLAENVSSTIEKKSSKLVSNFFQVIIGIILFTSFFFIENTISYTFESQNVELYSYVTNKILIYIAIVIFISVIFKIMKSIKLARELAIEKENLSKLLNMIHPYRSVNKKDISIVKKEIIDMRLNRIKFNA